MNVKFVTTRLFASLVLLLCAVASVHSQFTGCSNQPSNPNTVFIRQNVPCHSCPIHCSAIEFLDCPTCPYYNYGCHKNAVCLNTENSGSSEYEAAAAICMVYGKCKLKTNLVKNLNDFQNYAAKMYTKEFFVPFATKLAKNDETTVNSVRANMMTRLGASAAMILRFMQVQDIREYATFLGQKNKKPLYSEFRPKVRGDCSRLPSYLQSYLGCEDMTIDFFNKRITTAVKGKMPEEVLMESVIATAETQMSTYIREIELWQKLRKQKDLPENECNDLKGLIQKHTEEAKGLLQNKSVAELLTLVNKNQQKKYVVFCASF